MTPDINFDDHHTPGNRHGRTVRNRRALVTSSTPRPISGLAGAASTELAQPLALRLGGHCDLPGRAAPGNPRKPEVLLMDIRMPGMDGIEATRQITRPEQTAAARVLILTTFDLDEHVHAAPRAGASGFLLKDTPPADLLAAIRVIGCWPSSAPRPGAAGYGGLRNRPSAARAVGAVNPARSARFRS
jgi:CheY-like chemotaxis protein